MLALLLGCTLYPDIDTALPSTEFDYEPLPECEQQGDVGFLAPAPPNLMLLVDRSGSMDERACSGCGTRWESLMQLAPIVDGLGSSTSAGLTAFPDRGGDCEVEEIEVPIGPDNGDAILAELSTSNPRGYTPIAEAMSLVRRHAALQDPYRKNVVVMLSDGEPSCASEEDAVREAGLLASQPEPVELHVISFAADSGARGTLQEIASAGGAHVSGDNYYEADGIEELMERLGRVAASLETCNYVLTEDVAAEELIVTLGDTELQPCPSADCVEGYVYDPEARVVTLASVTCREAAAEECPDLRFDREG